MWRSAWLKGQMNVTDDDDGGDDDDDGGGGDDDGGGGGDDDDDEGGMMMPAVNWICSAIVSCLRASKMLLVFFFWCTPR